MFDTLLVANRGEIACRILRTARGLGIRTVAVYSEVDAGALHVREADEAVCVGPAPAQDSYLRVQHLVDAARSSGAQAVHPGYGFLSENAEFARACRSAGLSFVGPPAAAIEAMGQKAEAKRLMQRAGVPVVPGVEGGDQRAASLRSAAQRLGFPVLIKAVSGGGGKGMRRVDGAESFEAEYDAARREAAAAFGDDRVLVEKLIERPRHVEVQVFADAHGNVVHLFERDCSLQRRHQKVLEEAPAPGLSEGLSAAMGEAAVRAARAIEYEGAGTCEFLLDASGGAEDAPFYFMEMNTRLQVEHPVTELVCGVDLVEWQLRVACGESLPWAQGELRVHGHAIEARLYAEDPHRDYLPQTGTVQRLRWPTGPGVRVDAGVAQGDEVSVHYDPLLAKIICHGDSREQALARLRGALQRTEVSGVVTNLPLLRAVAGHEAFVPADLATDFLHRYADTLLVQPQEAAVAADSALSLACTAELLSRPRSAHNPWELADGFQVNLPSGEVLQMSLWGVRHEVQVEVRAAAHLELRWGDASCAVAHARLRDDVLSASLNGHPCRAVVVPTPHGWEVLLGGRAFRVERAAREHAGGPAEGILGAVCAPMPGKVLAVLVRAGDVVRQGEPLLRLEAMKMEHTLTSPAAARVQACHARRGTQVAEGDTLMELAPPADGQGGADVG